MVLGGVAAYLGQVHSGLSAAQIVNELCFSGGHGLTDEYGRLFSSLFSNHHRHELVVRALAAAPRGLSRESILEQANPGRLDPQYWLRQSERASWRAWSGYAFESLCLKNVDLIEQALGISGVSTAHWCWSHIPRPAESEPGAQIDLVIERADHTMNLCEMKFVISGS